MPAWLFTCSGLVFGIIIIGGLTRLTESGLSITEWEPITGILPPIGDEQWAVEWDKYKVSPEGIMWVYSWLTRHKHAGGNQRADGLELIS
jgi:cytochrome c oxidase assembly protein subunit 15